MKNLTLLIFIFIGLGLFAQKTWVELGAGTEFSAGIQSDGTLWTWGSNMNGQLGLGDLDVRILPTQVGTDNNWKAISCGAFHTLAIKNDGTLWAWGENSVYQLGLGNTTQLDVPTQVGTDNDWVSISSGYANNHAIKADGTLWGWGWNVYGHIGNNSLVDVKVPTQIGTATDWSFTTSGAAHTAGLKTDGTLWVWGFNGNGQLGLSSTTDEKQPKQLGTNKWKSVSCGHEYTSGIKTDGTLWSWGFNGNGQLGLGSTKQVNEPVQVGSANNWETVESGAASNFAINSLFELHGAGFNVFGTLGDGSHTDKVAFINIKNDVKMVYPSKGASDIGAVYGHHTLLLKNNDQTFICVTGSNYISQLGNGLNLDIMTFECNVGYIDEVGLTTEQNNNHFKIYPNPTSDFVTIEFNSDAPAQLTLYNNMGAQVLNQEVSSGKMLKLKYLEQGIYFYKVKQSNGRVLNGKLILN